MNLKIINTFLIATTRMFKNMFGLESNHASPYVLDNLISHRWEVTALVAVTGEARGVVAIRMHHALLEKLLVKSGVSPENDAERVELSDSMVGELVNIISGNALTELPDLKIDISVPVVVQGENHRIGWPKIAPVMAVPFRTAWGDFEVDICFK